MKQDALILVRGGGDLATGTIHRLWSAGLRVLVLETAHPAAIRRQVSLCEAVYEGETTVEGLRAVRIDTLEQAPTVWAQNAVPVLIDPAGSCVAQAKPDVLVDAILAKKNLGTTRDMAPLTIALGPGFTAGQDVDIVLTTREFVRMIRAEHINPRFLKEQAFDSPLGESTGAGVIFGVTGGVMEAALRTAYAVVEGKNPEADAFRAVRGREGRRETDFVLGDKTLHTCTVSGLANAEKLMEDIKEGRAAYDFVEVMACPGGCVGGGGQPIHDGCEFAEQRGGTLYRLDSERKLRFSHENPEVQKAYEEFLEKPLSRTAHKLLHSEHVNELYFETHNYL